MRRHTATLSSSPVWLGALGLSATSVRPISWQLNHRANHPHLISFLDGLIPFVTRKHQRTTTEALVFSRRFQTTDPPNRNNKREEAKSNEKATLDDYDERVIQRCQWESDELPQRLGFVHGEEFDYDRVKRNYFILAKFFHPDNPYAPPRAAEAFKKIKEAYDVLGATLKGSSVGGKVGADRVPNERFTYADEARRRAQVRVLGDGVVLFLLFTLFYIYVVCRHNKTRLGASYLWHFAAIFFIIQLFPRLLAATILFACHTTYLIIVAELEEQSAVALLLERNTHDLRVRLEGIGDKDAPHVVVQVQVSDAIPVESEPSPSPSAQPFCTPQTRESDAVGDPPQNLSRRSTTLTFDAGVVDFVLPLPFKNGRQRLSCHVKAVDQRRKFVLVDKSFVLTN